MWRRRADLLPRSYVDTVLASGGVPVLLPPLPSGAREALRAVDALVIAGGADVDPASYRAEPHPKTTGVRPERDAWELELLREALAQDLPVLGVCRGMQVLNVAYGGTLTQHLPDDVGHLEHLPARALFGTTEVRVTEGSRVAGMVGDRCTVSCYHHQAVRDLGTGLTAVAWAADGTVEAVEDGNREFVIGVQWHPEQDIDARLFAGLVQAARKRARVRESW
ncbi:glutamine amidotransferase [Longimycelium tulufanense]|uniref:Glutamine amidotransferase n=1 Tax=Longimycelium tulufanense TaxID=907463 RepID=A0A8J3C710_9PSEU|nr:glutamine amidotransferase [Longimycelium tulufanense]